MLVATIVPNVCREVRRTLNHMQFLRKCGEGWAHGVRKVGEVTRKLEDFANSPPLPSGDEAVDDAAAEDPKETLEGPWATLEVSDGV
jgi:hypothetical protein